MKYAYIIIIFLSILTVSVGARNARFCNVQDELAIVKELDIKTGERCLVNFAAGQNSRCWITGESGTLRILPHERFKGTYYPIIEGVAIGEAHGVCLFQPDAEASSEVTSGSLRYPWHAVVS